MVVWIYSLKNIWLNLVVINDLLKVCISSYCHAELVEASAYYGLRAFSRLRRQSEGFI